MTTTTNKANIHLLREMALADAAQMPEGAVILWDPMVGGYMWQLDIETTGTIGADRISYGYYDDPTEDDIDYETQINAVARTLSAAGYTVLS